MPTGARGRDSALRPCLPNYLVPLVHLAACLKCKTWRRYLPHSSKFSSGKVEAGSQEFMLLLSYIVHKDSLGFLKHSFLGDKLEFVGRAERIPPDRLNEKQNLLSLFTPSPLNTKSKICVCPPHEGTLVPGKPFCGCFWFVFVLETLGVGARALAQGPAYSISLSS